MTKFLNISTDNTLGGNSPSDVTVSSQKAIKEYVDSHGGSASADGTTINTNSSDELQAIGLINKNPASGATNPKYDWVGTLQEYETQQVEALHPDWICYITDDVSGGTSVYTKTEVNNLLATKADSTDVNNATLTITQGGTTKGTFTANASSNVTIALDAGGGSMEDIIDTLYPVGSIYIGTTSTCPLAAIKGSWTLVSSGKVLQGADSNHAAGTSIAAGLPNITGYSSWACNGFCDRGYSSQGSAYNKTSGALYASLDGGAYAMIGANGPDLGSANTRINIDASRSSSIYGNSTTVQPPAYVVNIWERTA
jgi:hypothetical protein